MKTCRVKLVLELKHSVPVTKQMLVHLCSSAIVLPHHGAFFISSSCMLVGGKIFEGDRIQNKKIPLPVLSPKVLPPIAESVKVSLDKETPQIWDRRVPDGPTAVQLKDEFFLTHAIQCLCMR